MKATLPTSYISNGRNYGGEKEMVSTLNLIGYKKGELVTLATVRTYMARKSDGASPVYCSLWVHGGNGHEGCGGRGIARGYGYHKASAAMSCALDSAGIKISERIDGVGESAMGRALEAIGRALGFRKLLIVRN